MQNFAVTSYEVTETWSTYVNRLASKIQKLMISNKMFILNSSVKFSEGSDLADFGLEN